MSPRRAPRRPPLPPREGLDAVRVRTPTAAAAQPWRTVGDFLSERLPMVPVAAWLEAGRFVDEKGHAFTGREPFRPAVDVWFHKDLPEPGAEPDVPGHLAVLHRDGRIVVVDKPHFMATTPRGVHVRQSALVKLRQQLDLPELAPAHRLDRLTAGVLVFTVEQRWRRPYQLMFENREVDKEYEALAPALPAMSEPTVVRSHIVKRRGSLQAVEVPGEAPNAETWLQMVSQEGSVGRYRLRPRTGRTHQLRVHMDALGAAIIGDPLYPRVSDAFREGRPENFEDPLRLVARELSFIDPIDHVPQRFRSSVVLKPDFL